MAKKQTLPWGYLVRHNNKPTFYWQYFDRGQKRNIKRSTGETEESKAFAVAKLWAVQYLAQRDGVVASPAQSYPLGAAYKEYYRDCCGRLSTAYLAMVAYYFDDLIVPYFGEDTPIGLIKSNQVTQFGNHLVGECGMAPQTANKLISSLSKLLKYAARSGWIDSLPFIARLPERQEEHGYELSDAEIDSLITAAGESPEHVFYFIVLCLYCGMRHREALRAKWEDIDWQRGIIHVINKNKTDMPAPLGKAQEILADVPAEKRHGPIVLYHDIITGQKRAVTDTMKRAWGTVRARAGLPSSVRIHDLRHTFTSRVFRLLGYDARFLSRHTSREAFVKYLHANREEVYQRAAEAF